VRSLPTAHGNHKRPGSSSAGSGPGQIAAGRQPERNQAQSGHQATVGKHVEGAALGVVDLDDARWSTEQHSHDAVVTRQVAHGAPVAVDEHSCLLKASGRPLPTCQDAREPLRQNRSGAVEQPQQSA